MKKILSLTLVILMLMSLVPTAFAAGNWDGGTTVTYTGTGTESWTVTVPADMAPGDTAEVVASGTWASNRKLTVTSDTVVRLVNNLNNDEYEDLDVIFTSIELVGSNTAEVSATEEIYVENVTVALFGTWSGQFNYNVGIADGENGDSENNQTIPSKYVDGDYIYSRPVISGNEYGASTLEEAWDAVNNQLALEGMTWDDLVASYIEYGFATTEEEVLADMGLTQETFEPSVFGDTWSVSLNLDVTDRNQTSYGPILESIYGLPVTDMSHTFSGCASLTTAPVIPNSVTKMYCTFSNCASLADLSDFVIPSNVTSLSFTFYLCTSLTDEGLPTIPSGVTSMMSTFQNCDSLTDLSDFVIPNSVTNMDSTFQSCENLTTAPVIPSSVTNMTYTFSWCRNLTAAPDIPDSVTDMHGTFQMCEKLTTAPDIPDGVTDMHTTFLSCEKLTTAPDIPDGVTDMWSTFDDCTALTGEISIPCSLASKNYTYDNCTATITYYHIDGCDGSCGQ